jgi:phage terminase large subunit-like protein
MATPKTSSSTSCRVTDYAQRVLSGEIVAGPHVRNACRRHMHDLEHGTERGLFFDYEEAERTYEFFETCLKLSEGQFDGIPFRLHTSQAFVVGSLFGWKRSDGTRRFRRAYVEQGKGNGKSPMAGGIGLLGLCADGEAGAQIYSAGSTKDQAAILFRDAVKMVRQSPALSKRLSFSGGEGREYNIAYLRSSSFFRPVSRETKKTGSGPRPHFALCDEVHEHPDRGIMEMLERGFKFRRSPLLFMITNSGSDRNSVCYEEHKHAICVAAGHKQAETDHSFVGEPLDDTTFSYVCSLDKDDDPLNDPSCWAKANPLLGVTITEEYLAGVVAQGKAIPGKLNNILRLHFCVWTDAETAWLPREAVEDCVVDFDENIHKGKRAAVGVDLSATQDLTALGYAVITGAKDGKPTFDAWCELWTPEDTMDQRELRDKLHYRLWSEQGHLNTTPGRIVDFRHVAARLADATTWLDVYPVAYDRYAYQRFENECVDLGLILTHAEHPQGGKRKGKPWTEGVEPLWMPESVKVVEEAILEGRIRLKANPLLISAIMSAITETDPWGNYWLAKRKSLNRIDPIIAVCMAVGAAMASANYAAPASPWDNPHFNLVPA